MGYQQTIESQSQGAMMSLARAEIAHLHRAADPDVLLPMIRTLDRSAAARAGIEAQALELLVDLRSAQSSGWINQFLQEYQLDTSEGAALLSLAEAFLRVPDSTTADRLIDDKLGDGDWKAHAGRSQSALVNTATWGLTIGRSLLGSSKEASALKRLIGRAGEPFVRQAVKAAMRLMGDIFVMGRTIEEAIRRMESRPNRGFTASFDMLGEAARTFEDADLYFRSYEAAIRAAGIVASRGHSISVKLSALHPRYEAAQHERCLGSLTERAGALAALAAEHGIGMTIDAEESERLEMSLDIIEGVSRLPELSGWDGLGMAVQAYSKRARPVIAWANALGQRDGRRIAVRLVKGAYWDTEIKHAQEQGLPDYPVFTRKAATDVSYLACARDMLGADHIYPAFATHNALTVATLLEWAGERRDFEFQRLHGMGEGLYERLIRERGYQARIYAPVGGHRDLLAYLVRRLLENGANSSFVHQLADKQLRDRDLLADPVAKVLAVGAERHSSIPLPTDLFAPDRRNSEGLDLNNPRELARIAEVVGKPIATQLNPCPTAEDLVARALDGFAEWSARGVEHRADCLDRLADLLEQDRDVLMAIAVQEAKKTIPDAVAEVREAVDFCRYYAQQARVRLQPVTLPGPTGERNVLRMEGRGAWVCIAPWNFPLAIFIGQVAAALAGGNSVVAKPASQTPLIAQHAVRLAHEAGIPTNALLLAAGRRDLGQKLMEDVRIAGVAFTGSTSTAKTIARTLLADDRRPIIPLIAETGGINSMIVDSSALPEQVVQDVVTSAFRSAGQRCSALRLLLLQEDVAPAIVRMLSSAMDTLIVGDPADPRTDVGPVIDDASYQRLMSRRSAMRDRIVKTVEVPAGGLFVPPTLIGLDAVEDLEEEWFGPLLHLATWRSGQLRETVERVNKSGFGLTMGLHSRIARSAQEVEASACVGNLYVNRSMIGAIVGSQPFGGEGLSGTGPKAGGPSYLPRFCTERVTSTDTTSSGGNATLLSLADL